MFKQFFEFLFSLDLMTGLNGGFGALMAITFASFGIGFFFLIWRFIKSLNILS